MTNKTYASLVNNLPVGGKTKGFLKRNQIEVIVLVLLLILLFQPFNMELRLLVYVFGFPAFCAFVGFRRRGIFGAILGIIIGFVSLIVISELLGGFGDLGLIFS